MVAAAAAFAPEFVKRVRPGVSASSADYEATFLGLSTDHWRQDECYEGQLHPVCHDARVSLAVVTA